ncbi:uncharacterized protein LOC144095473 [Amblyomma americanum]
MHRSQRSVHQEAQTLCQMQVDWTCCWKLQGMLTLHSQQAQMKVTYRLRAKTYLPSPLQVTLRHSAQGRVSSQGKLLSEVSCHGEIFYDFPSLMTVLLMQNLLQREGSSKTWKNLM